MKRKTTTFTLSILLGVLAICVAGAGIVTAGVGPPANDSFWVDGELYRTVGTPTALPDHGPSDGIYAFGGELGQTNVAEAKPGDQDYNGGRWNVTVVGFTEAGVNALDQDGDGTIDTQLMSWEEVKQAIADGYVEVLGPGPHFECPVIPENT